MAIIEKYALLEQVPKSLLLYRDHENQYEEIAFGDYVSLRL